MELTEKQINAIMRAVGQLTWHGKVIPYERNWQDKAATAGTNNHEFDKVDPRRIRVITHAACYNDVSACTFIYIQHWNGRELVEDEGGVAPAIGEIVRFAGMLVLPPNGYMAVSFEGCTSGDDLYAVVSGYDVLLEE
uniref:Uncharacterized protein n=1 Tax=viral metagenome TaxID=1070528 RepID=A0A6H2A0X6_9ZZZZ